MPKVAMDFSKTVIYHFVCKDEMIKCSYVGSTTNFNKRKNGHKTKCNNENGKHYHLKIYQTIRDNGGWINWEMKPLEEFPCENMTQQVIREQYWIEQLKPDMNCVKAYISEEDKIEWRKEYYVLNKDTFLKNRKEYREVNSHTIKEKASAKYTCECGSVFRINDKARHELSIKHQVFIAPTPSVVE